MLECAANSASTRTPMPFAAKLVMKVRRPLWLVASAMSAASYMRSNSWHMVLAENAAPFSIETLAMNARTSTDMIDRFYGSHVLSALDKGTEIVDSVHAKQERYAARKAEKEGKQNG